MSVTSHPFAAPSTLAYGLPDFAEIQVEDLPAALDQGMTDELAEVAQIAGDPAEATFSNTIEALERSGQFLDRVSRVFFNQTASDTSPALQEVETAYAARFAAHRDAVLLDRGLFARIATLWDDREALDLDAEKLRVLERYHLDHVRAGAGLGPVEQDRLRVLNAALADASTDFGTRLLADTNDAALHLTDVGDLAGLSPDAIAAAGEAAKARRLDGYLITLVLPTHQPALETLARPAVRRRLLEASVTRGRRGNAHDTTDLVRSIVTLRAERAALLGYPTHSDYVLADRTARSNAGLDAMLDQLYVPAVANAKAEEAVLAAAMAADGETAVFSASDWAYYAQRVKRERYAVDSDSLRPYFELRTTLVDGVFSAAEQLYGLTFTPRPDLRAHHPDAEVFEVHDADGSALGLFIGDYFTRDSKRGGAWMNSLVSQSHLLEHRSVVVNNMNLPKPPAGQPALLGPDQVRTMFHEFGHALHALLSDVTYPRVAGTAVARDFVEYPSQVNEMWMTWPSVLEHYARHHATGQPLSGDVIARMQASAAFNQGFDTVAYLGAAVIDLAWHRMTSADVEAYDGDLTAFEERALDAYGLNLASVPPRYRSNYFNHIFSGTAYSAGYYSYIWSEVLDADTVQWFTESGGLSRDLGDTFRAALLSRGGSRPEMACFEDFRGRPPQIGPLLVRRGLQPDGA